MVAVGLSGRKSGRSGRGMRGGCLVRVYNSCPQLRLPCPLAVKESEMDLSMTFRNVSLSGAENNVVIVAKRGRRHVNQKQC